MAIIAQVEMNLQMWISLPTNNSFVNALYIIRYVSKGMLIKDNAQQALFLMDFNTSNLPIKL